MLRPVQALPKAHLHLHFTGSMRLGTLLALAEKHSMRLPEALTTGWPPKLRATDERGWFRFQRLYDMARACVRDEEDMRRIVREAAQDDAAEGSRWLEIQVDPTSYAPFVGGHHARRWRSCWTRPGSPPRPPAPEWRGRRGVADAAPAGRAHAGPARRPLRR